MVEISFYLLSFAALAMLLLLFRGYTTRKKLTAFLSIPAWLMYLVLLDQTELLWNYELPPRIPLLVVIPAISGIILLVNRKLMHSAYVQSPLHLPVILQSFRILVELLIYATYRKGIFPQRATFEGLNYDILVGISALLMGVAVSRGMIKEKGILIWNFGSICILAVTVYAFISSYYFEDISSQIDKYQFVTFPFLLLASVLLPVAVFLHAFSVKQVLTRRK